MARIETYVVMRMILVAVGVLLAAAAVIGVVYALEHRGAQVRHDQSAQIASQEVKQQQTAQVGSGKTQNSSTSTATTSTTTTTTKTSTPTSTVATTTSTELPKTGPSDELGVMMVLTILAFVTASYVMSRRHLKAL